MSDKQAQQFDRWMTEVKKVLSEKGMNLTELPPKDWYSDWERNVTVKDAVAEFERGL